MLDKLSVAFLIWLSINQIPLQALLFVKTAPVV